jgi:pimeloyl-ACP methyl ester carboxylesterase
MLCTGEGVDVILGHSLGAIVAARLSVLYPHLASRLVLVDPPGTRSRDYVQRADEVRNRVAQVKADPQSWVRKLLGENPWMDEEQARWRVEAHLSNDSEAVVSLVRSLAQIDTVKILGEVRGPTLLVLASEEKGSTLPEEERTAAVRAMKDAEVSTLPTGHIVHLEAPKDFLAVLKNWLVRTEHRSGHIE